MPQVREYALATSPAWNLRQSELLTELSASDAGLTSADAAARFALHGPNDALERQKRPFWREVADRFANPLILILLFASGLSAWTGQVASFVITIVIIAMSVVLDLVQQARAETAVEALRRSVGLRADVIRDGLTRQIEVEKLVPGDVVRIAAGDIVPADCRLLSARDLFVNQALLTGELFPVEKRAGDLPLPTDEVSAATNTVFMGTSIISGTGKALVFGTGARSELGALAGSLASRRPKDSFEIGIRRFGLLLLRLTIFLVLFVLAANLFYHRPWLELLLFAVALAVGLTPELLPMVITVTLANGAQRLAKRRVIVKRPEAIHDLGAMDVLCADKTGTLTELKIRLVRHLGPDGRDADSVFRLAYLNSAFETGIKSPLDDADARAPDARHFELAQDRRGAVRFRAPARVGAGGRRDLAPPDRKGRSGRHHSIVEHCCGR